MMVRTVTARTSVSPITNMCRAVESEAGHGRRICSITISRLVDVSGRNRPGSERGVEDAQTNEQADLCMPYQLESNWREW